MTHPASPCTAYCNGRCVGCRSACDAWQKYEAEMVTMTVGRKKVVESMKKG